MYPGPTSQGPPGAPPPAVDNATAMTPQAPPPEGTATAQLNTSTSTQPPPLDEPLARLKGIFHKEQPAGPNFGFTPTAAMAQRHEDALVSSKRPRFQFQVTKLRNWRTGYIRLLCFYDDHVSTMNPDTHQPTNTWNYSQLVDFGTEQEANIWLQFDKEKLKFQCHNVDKARVLTSLLESSKAPSPVYSSLSYNPVVAQRWTRHGSQVPCLLQVNAYCLQELHPATRQHIQRYKLVDLAAVSFTSDDPTGLILHLTSKPTTRLFSVQTRTEMVTAMRQALQKMGMDLRMAESRTTLQWKQERQERLHLHKRLTIASEYSVTKQSRRHDAAVVGSAGWAGGVVHRRLCVAGNGLLLEKDASDGLVVSTWSLQDLYAIVRPPQTGDQVLLEFSNGLTRHYSASARDSLIVSLLDAATTLGRNPKVHVSDVPSSGYNLASFAISAAAATKSGGLFQPISIPQHGLKRVHSVATAAFSYLNSTTESSTEEGQPANPIEECRNVVEMCREFNASVLPTAEGLPTGEKDKFVLGSIGALWGLAAELLEYREKHLAERAAGPMFQTLHRLAKTPAGYKHSVELATLSDCLPLLWTIEDPFCKFWAFRTLAVLLSGQVRSRDKEAEFVNKSVIFKAGGPRLLRGFVHSMLSEKVSDLIPMVMSDILQSILCSFADTTTPEHFSSLIQALGENYQALLNTLYQRTPFVIENSALLLHLLSTHAPEIAARIREAALSSSILLHHFHAAIFSPLEGQRFLSRFLCSLWLAGPMDCNEKKLLKRMVPSGFMNFLRMPALSAVEEDQLDQLERDAVEENIPEEASSTALSSAVAGGAAGTNTGRLRSRITLSRATSAQHQQQQQGPPENFRIFFHVLTQNHSLPDLIWNQQTRRELRIGLESEIQYVQRETEARGINQIAWNHQQFGIDYPSLENELRVGSVYMRLWLQAGEGFIKSWDEPLRLFELLFRRFLCEMDRNNKITVMCIRSLERLYAIHGSTIGAFPDVMILVRSMASTRNTETQHRLLGLLATILGVRKDEKGDESTINVPENAEQVLNTESIEQLCQFVAWGHTNGVQVGNLMTSVLGTGHPGFAMLTDGTTSAPSSTSGSVDHNPVAPDWNCPPVWFIAPAGRIPPPQDNVRGPYRVSQLKELIDNGDITPFHLVTSSHVDSYEDEDNGDSTNQVKEDQIDTGKWRRVDQVWQLRWQLCNQAENGIYSPSQVAIMAIRSLTRLVDLHKSLDYRGLPYYPIPIAKRIMCGLGHDPFTSAEEGSSDQRNSFLSILAQSLLCNDSETVDKTAELLVKLTEFNEEACSKFYLTGAFFFASCYTGSNFKKLAKLLHDTHLKQHFRSGFAATADQTELPLKDRSILGSMLPEGVLYILLNYGEQRFNEVFVGNFDTPEVIWNLEMRKHLIEMVRQHLGDFPKRLWQNTTTKYEYCPMPGIAYKRLEREIFCHNYYLHNLCDETRFPDWPIAEPVEVFKACLEQFKKQIQRDETEQVVALQEAIKVLKMKPGDGSKELRKSYRALARIYHPDKNPGGRDMFESIQAAYELLLPLVESGQSLQSIVGGDGMSEVSSGQDLDASSAEGFAGGILQMKAMHLLIRAQSLICRRFEVEMGKYKYPIYGLLLSCLSIPRSEQGEAGLTKSPLMTATRAEFVRDALELVFRTCLVSPLNAEELVSESGVDILAKLLDFYVEAAHSLDDTAMHTSRMVSDEVIASILANIVHTLSGVAYYENGRKAIAAMSNRSHFCIIWRRCLDGNYLGDRIRKAGDSLVKRYALEGISYMSRDAVLQAELIGAGVVWPLLRFLLGFDPTLDDRTISRESVDDDVGISQASSNIQARLATRALGMLCGVLHDSNLSSSKNESLQNALDSLLTKPIATLLRNKRTTEILTTLNVNIETPSRIWNTTMRGELMKFIEKMIAQRPENAIQSVQVELSQCSGFEYALLKDELRVGGIYVRLFNQMGLEKGAIREVQDPKGFCEQLLDRIAKGINEYAASFEGWVPLGHVGNQDLSNTALTVEDRRFVMVMKALRVLVRTDGLFDDILSGLDSIISPILLSLLELPQESEAFEIGADVLAILCPKEQFANAIARQGALWRLLWLLERPDSSDEGKSSTSDLLRKQNGWMYLESLSSTPSVASKIVESSAWLELLGILVGYAEFTKTWVARTGAAKTLSRLLWDPKTGPVIAPLIQRFLPETLTVVLKEEGAEKMLNLFDGDSDTPDLIWDGTMRTELRRVIGQVLGECIHQRVSSGAKDELYVLEPTVRVKYARLEDELFIGGVYVLKFLKEPTYNVRDPTTFLERLMLRWTHELQLCTSTQTPIVERDDSAITKAGPDALQSVTNAGVYLCKVRVSLCDKLSSWGYMSRCLTFMENVLDRDLVGTPLLSVLRILHVAVNSRSNVDSLIQSGKNDRLHGVVPLTMRALEANGLHQDAAFMLEMLKKLFIDALGDLKATSNSSEKQQQHYGVAMAPSPAFGDEPVSRIRLLSYAMAPSPAPGEGPVSRNRVTTGNPLDDPLAMMETPTQPSTQPPPSAAVGYPAPQSTYTSQAMYPNQHGTLPHSQGYQQQPVSGMQGYSQQQQYGVQSQNQSYGHQVQGGVAQHTQYYHQNSAYGMPQQASGTYGNQGVYTQQRATPPQTYQPQGQGNMGNTSNRGYLSTQSHGTPMGTQHQHTQMNTQGFTLQQRSPSGGPTNSVNFATHPQYSNVQAPYDIPTPTPMANSQVRPDTSCGSLSSNGAYSARGRPPAPQFQQPQQPQQQQYQQSQQGYYQGATGFSAQSTQQVSAPAPQSGLQQPTSQGRTFAHYTQSPVTTQGQEPHVATSTMSNPNVSQAVGGTYGNAPQPIDAGPGAPQASAKSPVPHSAINTNNPLPPGSGVTTVQVATQQGESGQNPPTLPVAPAVDARHGTGLDARSALDPKEEAERRLNSVPGAPGAADGRMALLKSAILCQLPKFILENLLENGKLSTVKDPAAVKVHGVAILKLLTQDPGYGLKFQLILDDIPSWKKYKSQDHSLFITGPEQVADYFLTDGSDGEAKKLLTHK
eukprot:Nitzschia sp. Nitz4//scaffold10_size219509//158366//167608//NITZ4_001449-RA/size219509-augustus-gene-0.252-mRNA-1//1//CDS//3329532983//945//frame0